MASVKELSRREICSVRGAHLFCISSTRTEDHLLQADEIMTQMFDIAIRRARLRGAVPLGHADIGISECGEPGPMSGSVDLV